MSNFTDMESKTFVQKHAVWSRMDKVRVSMYKMFHMSTADPETQAYKSAHAIWLVCVRSFGNENVKELLNWRSYASIFSLNSDMIEIADILQESSWQQ